MVTIIVLIILATVSINAVFGENGIIKRAELAKQEMKLSEYEETIDLIVLDEYTGKIIDETKKNSKIIDLVKGRLEEEDWVGNVESVDGEDNQLKVITKDGYIIVIEVNEDGTTEIIEKGKDDGEPYPEIELTQIPLEGTENEKIQIKVVASVRTTDKTKKISKVRLVKPEENAEEKEYADGGVIFEVEGNGKYTFEAETNAGKISRKSIGISIVEPESDITIVAEPTTARNTTVTGTKNGVATGPISVTINYGETSLQKLYKKETDTDWTEVSGTSITFEVTENIAIYAKYSDGTNSFDSVSYNIANVDNVAPTFNESDIDVTANGATITATVITEATDTAADSKGNVAASGIGGIEKYEYSNGGSTYQPGNTFTVSSAGKYTIYVKAIDNAGNETVVSKQVTVSGYTVTYDANGGSGAPAAQTAISGTSLTLSSTAPTKTGYDFLGWSTSNTATSATYTAGQTITPTSNMTLYAVWEIASSTTTPIANSGAGNKIDMTWSELITAANTIAKTSSIDSNTSSVTIGDKTLTVGDYTTVQYDGVDKKVRIIGFNHDTLADGSGTAGITFEFVTTIESAAMSSNDTNSGGWGSSEMKTTNMSTYLNKIESTVKNAIKPVTKTYNTDYGTTNTGTSTDSLWLLACSEIWDKGYDSSSSPFGYCSVSEGNKYKYYALLDAKFYGNEPNLVKYTTYDSTTNTSSSSADWWLRSPHYQSGSIFCIVDSTGFLSIDHAENTADGVAPGFCI